MSQLQLWSELFDKSTVNIVELDGEFWFQVSHVCKLLGHSNPTVALQSHTDEDERQHLDIGKHELINFVSESGLYGLIFGSQKPIAKKFKRWLRREVLPKLRSQGYYLAKANAETLALLKAEIKQLEEANQLLASDRLYERLIEKFVNKCIQYQKGKFIMSGELVHYFQDEFWSKLPEQYRTVPAPDGEVFMKLLLKELKARKAKNSKSPWIARDNGFGDIEDAVLVKSSSIRLYDQDILNVTQNGFGMDSPKNWVQPV